MDLSSFGVETKPKKEVEVFNENFDIDFSKIGENLKVDTNVEFLPWFLKYKLENFDDLIITNQITRIINFIEKKEFLKKGLLLFGRPGCGKTTTLTLLSKKYDYELFELNASDARSKKSIEATVYEISKMRSLFAKSKLILIDEVDGVSGRDDRGGVGALVKLVKENKSCPIVFSANDIESEKIKALKKVCIVIDFENHSKTLLKDLAFRILSSENVSFDKSEVERFVLERDSFDIRGFINDLQSSVFDGKFEENSNLELRDYKKKIATLLEEVFYSTPKESYLNSFNTDINLDVLFLYLEENVPEEFAKYNLIKAFNEITKADVFRGRIRNRQYYRYLVYVNFYLTYGISSIKKGIVEKKKNMDFKRNTRILKKWIYANKVNNFRGRTKVEKSKDVPLRFMEKLAKSYGRSVKRTRSEDFFNFILSYQNDENFRKIANIQFEIDEATKKSLVEF